MNQPIRDRSVGEEVGFPLDGDGRPRRDTAGLPPHAGQPVAVWGRAHGVAESAVILVHGRGATAQDILTLAPELDQPDCIFLAPQAAGNTWYPYSFLAPRERNEPGRSSGLAALESLLDQLAAEGIPAARVALLGFSQGACLTLEFAARNPRRFRAICGLTGGLLGPPGSLGEYPGSLAGTPVFLGCGDPDPHVPWQRVEETAAIFQRLDAQVTLQRYPGRAHTVSADEIAQVRALLAQSNLGKR